MNKSEEILVNLNKMTEDIKDLQEQYYIEKAKEQYLKDISSEISNNLITDVRGIVIQDFSPSGKSLVVGFKINGKDYDTTIKLMSYDYEFVHEETKRFIIQSIFEEISKLIKFEGNI